MNGKRLLAYLECYHNQFLYQKAGFLLETQQQRLFISDEFLKVCRERICTRLSVDLDFDFIPNLPLEDMETERKKITELLKTYMLEKGYILSGSSRYGHSLDSMLFQYQNAGGNGDSIKLEVNYSLRAHIFMPIERKIVTDIFEDEVLVRTLEPMEIFAAKANALMSRAAARDLYDFNNMIYFGLFDEPEYELLRKCIIFYASISAEQMNKAFDTSAIDRLNFSRIRRNLLFSDKQIRT